MAGEVFHGEGRVVSVNDKCGFVQCRKMDSKIFIIPSSLKMPSAGSAWPLLTEMLHLEDVVTFEAVRQTERAGAKYVALDGTVKLQKRAQNMAYEGDGTIKSLDLSKGVFGFLENAEIGAAYFNVAAVRPQTNDVNTVLKVGKKVKFRAIPLERANSTSKWKATLVCPPGKASEFMKKPQQQQQQATVTKPSQAVGIRDKIGRIRALSGISLTSSTEDWGTESPPRFSSSTNNSPLNQSNTNSPRRQQSPAYFDASSQDSSNLHNSNFNFATGGIVETNYSNRSSPICPTNCPSPKFQYRANEIENRHEIHSSDWAMDDHAPIAQHSCLLPSNKYDDLQAYTLIARDVIFIAHQLDEKNNDNCPYCRWPYH